jgi:hypothetical protein
MLLLCVLNNAKALESQGFQSFMTLFKCKGFGAISPKLLHLSPVHCDTPAKIRIDYMTEFYKNGLKEPFL